MRVRRVRRVVVGAALAAAGCRGDRETTTARYELGRSATPSEIASLDTDVRPDGHGLPTGHGSVATGAMLYQQKCQMCHGTKGEGLPPAYPALIGRDPAGEQFPFAKDFKIMKTIGNYDEVYALTAYLLAANKVITADAVLDSASLMQVKMPYHDRFVPDTRHGGAELK
jgi:cytochrome c2